MSEGILPTTLEGYVQASQSPGACRNSSVVTALVEVTFWLIDNPHFVDGRWIALAKFAGALVLIELRVSLRFE
jgi:hypothetical protein